MKQLLIVACTALAMGLHAYTLRIGSMICNPGTTVAIPVTIDTVEGLASAEFTVSYDPLVLELKGVQQGDLAEHFSFSFSSVEEEGQTTVVSVAEDNLTTTQGGTLAVLNFYVRENSDGIYSDLTLSEVILNERTMTKDLRTAIVPQSGLLRIFSQNDVCTDRLTDDPITLLPDTQLQGLTLREGDILQVATDTALVALKGTVDAEGNVQFLLPDEVKVGTTVTRLKDINARFAFANAAMKEKLLVSTSKALVIASKPTVPEGVAALAEATAQRLATLAAEQGVYSVALTKESNDAQGAELFDHVVSVKKDDGEDVVTGTATVDYAFGIAWLTIRDFDGEHKVILAAQVENDVSSATYLSDTKVAVSVEDSNGKALPIEVTQLDTPPEDVPTELATAVEGSVRWFTIPVESLNNVGSYAFSIKASK